MNPPQNDDALDRLLREQVTYVEDNGFTARVTTALPRRRHGPLRTALLLGATALGLLLTVSWFGSSDMPSPDLSSIQSLNSQILWTWLAEMLAFASFVAGAISAVQPEAKVDG